MNRAQVTIFAVACRSIYRDGMSSHEISQRPEAIAWQGHVVVADRRGLLESCTASQASLDRPRGLSICVHTHLSMQTSPRGHGVVSGVWR